MTTRLVLAATLAPAGAPAVAQGTLRIGVLNDMSSVYSDFQGPGSVTTILADQAFRPLVEGNCPLVASK